MAATNREKVKRTAAARANAANKKNTSAREYFKGVKTELSKVVWPTKKELATFTGVVISVCAFFALAFWRLKRLLVLKIEFRRRLNYVRSYDKCCFAS